MRTLVAAPHGSKKRYSFPAWEAATRPYDRLVAMHSDDDPCYIEEVTGQVPVVLFDRPPAPFNRQGRNAIYGPLFNEAWRTILGYAHHHCYSHVLSLETDVIPPEGTDILALMEEHHRGDFLIHLYPWRASTGRATKADEMGCTLASVPIWRDVLERHPDDQLYGAFKTDPDYHVTRIDLVELAHLDDDGRSEPCHRSRPASAPA
jgi:hypothetical protein